MFLLIGVLGVAVSIAGLWYCLPRNGRFNPLVGTVFEPYLAIAITLGLVLSGGVIAVGIIDLLTSGAVTVKADGAFS